MKQDDEEDAPTYVLEDTNQSLTKAEYEALVAGKEPGKSDETAEEGEKPEVAQTDAKSKDNIVELGKITKKRKAIKVIGEEEKEDAEESTKASDVKVTKKAKKRGKPIKLSFGDQDEG